MKEHKLYRILRPVVTFLFKILYHPKIIEKENIPKKGRVVLAGNHTNNLDCVFLVSSTKRPIHFLAKKELIDGKLSFLFKRLNLIPVDRINKKDNALKDAIKVLNNDKIIGIFPEATLNRSNNIILPFKIGAVKMAHTTKAKIIPFVIRNKYKIFGKSVEIIFLKPYEVLSDDLDLENKKLMDTVSNILKEGKN